MLGVRTFFCAAITHLQCKLPLQNNLLQDLGCLHPKHLELRRTQSAIQNVARKLQPEIDVSLVSDEWKALQSDSDIDSIDKEQRIEHYWNDVFALKSVANTNRYTTAMCHQIWASLGSDECWIGAKFVDQRPSSNKREVCLVIPP